MHSAENRDRVPASTRLYPACRPFDDRMLEVSGGHRIHVEQCGNPAGKPVVVLHGGPGGGASPNLRRFFDPTRYRVVLFDQRGCGRSEPHASVASNTTWDLVSDIEIIRKTFGIDRWIVFGGSWGATLGLIYAQSHPDRVRHLVLRGPFLFTEAELDWFYGGGAARFFPDQWRKFVGVLPERERGDVIGAFHRRLFSDDPAVQTRFAHAWSNWENALASMGAAGNAVPLSTGYALAFARLECHYFVNRGFLDGDGFILRNMSRIGHIPGTIVQGRFDMVCPPSAAFELHDAWPESRLHVVGDAGHSVTEPGIAARLVETMDRLR